MKTLESPRCMPTKLGFIWAKYEETENFETVAGFSIFTETGS